MNERSVWLRPQTWLGIAVSVVCLFAISFFVDEQKVMEAARTADYRWLLLAFIVQLVYLWLRAVRWRFMLGNDITTPQTFRIQNIGYMITSLLPLRLGEIAKVILLKAHPPLTIGQGLSTVVLERILDLLMVLTLLPIGLLSVETLPEWAQGGVRVLVVLALIGIVVVIVAANNRGLIGRIVLTLCKPFSFLNGSTWKKRVDTLLDGLKTLTQWKSGSILFLLTIITWLTVMLSYQFGMFAFGLRPSFLQATFVMCAAALSIAAPSSPGGLGVFHAGVISAMSLFGWDSDVSTSYAFLYHALIFSTNVALGAIGLARTQTSFGQLISSSKTFVNPKE